MRRLVIALLAALFALPATATAAPCPGADPCPYSASSVIGKRAGGVLRFPQASAVGADGSVYVADQYSHAIQVFGPDGQFRARDRRPLDRRLTSVGAVAVGPDGSVYVADGARPDRPLRRRRARFISSGAKTGSGVGEFRFGAGRRQRLRRRRRDSRSARRLRCSSPTPATTGSSASRSTAPAPTVIVPTGRGQAPAGSGGPRRAADRGRRQRAPAGRLRLQAAPS